VPSPAADAPVTCAGLSAAPPLASPPIHGSSSYTLLLTQTSTMHIYNDNLINDSLINKNSPTKNISEIAWAST
jgi:hypothetical protein